jgi:phage terminase large subunit-like protein
VPRKPSREQLRHPVSRYAADVLAGRIVAGHYIRRAAQRHLDDLKRDDLHFDVAAATRGIEFFPSFLRHPDGSVFELLPWQAFAVGQLFGWKTGAVRRFKYVYLSTGKGAGKSPLVSGVAVCAWFLDDEPSAELYCSATTKEQAGVQFRDVARMAGSAPSLAKELDIEQHNITRASTGSFLRPVSSEGKALDGKRVSVALVDELQEHPSAEVLDKMTLGTKNRKQPIIAITSNAGYGHATVAGRVHDLARSILDGETQHDAWLPLIFALDPCAVCRAAGHFQPNEQCPQCDQWTDERCWKKANPSLGTVLPRAYLEDAVRVAKDQPSMAGIVMRLNFSLWTSASVRWLSADLWGACGTTPVDRGALRGRSCVLGVDLGENHDHTAVVVLVGDEAAGYDVLPFFFTCEQGLDERARRDRAPYRDWERDGLLEVVPGPVVTFNRVRAVIEQLSGEFDVREVALDKWRAKQLESRLVEDGLVVVEVAPTAVNIAPAASALERALKEGKLRHGNHPILSWNASNAVADVDAAGNVRPSKVRSGGRIDGVSALVAALARAIAQPTEESVYDRRGVVIL